MFATRARAEEYLRRYKNAHPDEQTAFIMERTLAYKPKTRK